MKKCRYWKYCQIYSENSRVCHDRVLAESYKYGDPASCVENMARDINQFGKPEQLRGRRGWFDWIEAILPGI